MARKQALLKLVEEMKYQTGLSYKQIVERMSLYMHREVSQDWFDNKFRRKPDQNTKYHLDELMALVDAFTTEVPNEPCTVEQAIDLFSLAGMSLKDIAKLKNIFPLSEYKRAFSRKIQQTFSIKDRVPALGYQKERVVEPSVESEASLPTRSANYIPKKQQNDVHQGSRIPRAKMVTPSIDWLRDLRGFLGADAYSTAWVAMIPALDNPSQPAWAEAMNYLRVNQLEDGGWGEPEIYYAHERTISTLACILALHTWSANYLMIHTRLHKALEALHRYAQDLPNEPYAPVGFELLLPSLVEQLPVYHEALPLAQWDKCVSPMYKRKLEYIQSMEINLDEPRAWWYSLELLPVERLAELDDRVLNEGGSIQTSVAATAAYLRAKRLHGQDSPRAAEYLQRVIEAGNGSVPFSFPAENFERILAIDNFRRIGLHPADPMITTVIHALHESWYYGTEGFSSSDFFAVNDGDDTLLGFGLLNWAGFEVDEQVMFGFWKGDHFCSYPDESDPSNSANIHGLEALCVQVGFPNKDYALAVIDWLRDHMSEDVPFHDKWHLSPLYPVSHALHAVMGLDDVIAERCLEFLLTHQREDGGWGWFGKSTQEETAHCIIALGYALKHNFLEDISPLVRAAQYLSQFNGQLPQERLWVGKTLFRPEGLVKALMYAAKAMLAQLGLIDYLYMNLINREENSSSSKETLSRKNRYPSLNSG